MINNHQRTWVTNILVFLVLTLLSAIFLPSFVSLSAEATPSNQDFTATSKEAESMSSLEDISALPPVAPQGFVTRQGNRLLLDGKPFKIVGPNMPWLGLDEFNEHGQRKVSYPTHFRIEDGLTTARKMGATVVRSHSLGISTGCSLCLMPRLGQFNEAAFEPMDYAIATAGRHGLKLIIPLTDQWHYYHGGKHNFTNWLGYPNIPGATPANNGEQRKREARFYTDPKVITAFEDYIRHLLNHTNQYTGLKYKDDPTIMAWETGNELWDATDDWTRRVARYLKQLAPRHLVSDGGAATGARLTPSRVVIPELDIVGGHFYPIGIGWMMRDAAVAAQAGKVYYVGEYDWQNYKGGPPLDEFLAEIERNPAISGDLYWNLRPRADKGGYVEHEKQYDLHYPSKTPVLRPRVELIRAHAYRLRGLPMP